MLWVGAVEEGKLQASNLLLSLIYQFIGLVINANLCFSLPIVMFALLCFLFLFVDQSQFIWLFH